MRTGKNARTYPTLVRVRKGFLRWEWEPVRDTQSWFPHVRMSVTQSVVPKLTESNCPSQGVFTSRPVVDESPLLRHDYVIPGVVQRNRARTRARHDHTHTHYMESTTETLSVPCVGGRPHPPFAQILRASSPKDSNASPTNRLRVSLPCGIASS